MSNLNLSANALPGILLLLFIFFSAPITIGRLANLAGRSRLSVMVVLLLLLWSIASPIVGYFVLFRGDFVASSFVASTLAAIIVLAVPLILGGRLLARVIALRYAPTVADTLASVIVASIASFIPPVLSTYLSFYFLATSYDNSFLVSKQTKPLPFIVIGLMIGVMILFTAGAAWILMGWGSMPVLRRRKGTVLGLVCVGLVVLFSIVLTLLVVSFNGVISSISGDSFATFLFAIVLLVAGSISIVIGMLTAGFMHGILVGLSTFFDFVAFLATAIFMFAVILINIADNDSMPGASISLKLVILILALSAIQIRTNLIGHRVISMLGLLLLAIPFVISVFLLQPGGETIPILIVLFVLLLEWLSQWGVMLRHMRYGGHISTGLVVVTIVFIPLIFLIH